MARAGIIGVGQTTYRTKHPELSTPGLGLAAAAEAVAMAGIEWSDLDAIVFASAPDAFEGVHQPQYWVRDALPVGPIPLMRIHTGGATGVSAAIGGALHVVSGRFERVLVLALQRVAESKEAQVLLNSIWDPFFERNLGLTIINAIAIQAGRQLELHGQTREHMAMVSVKNHANAVLNPYSHLRKAVTMEEVLESRMLAWPISLLDACPRSDGACALILASERAARGRDVAWVSGYGASSDAEYMGDRLDSDGYSPNYEYIESLTRACQKAYPMAGVVDPRKDIDLFEVYAPFSHTELGHYSAMGLCEPVDAGKLVASGQTDIGGATPVNPSGGVQTANPIGASGLVRIAEGALQIMGKAGAHQVDGVRRVATTAAGGSAQFYSVMMLDKQKP